MLKNRLFASLRTKLLVNIVVSMFISTVLFIFLNNSLLYEMFVEKISFIQYQSYMRWVFLLSIVVFIFIFSIIFRQTLHYIREMERGIKRMASGNFDRLIKVKGCDELASLSQNINKMASELKQKFEDERQLEKEKTELIMNVSHDLRTPLTSMLGFLQAIKEKRYESSEELEEYVDIIYQKSKRLQNLSDDLFELTKLTSSGVQLDNQCVSLNMVIQQLLNEYESSLPKDVHLRKILSSEEIIIHADIEKFIRLLENLISNAIKHGLRPGEIVIETRIENNQLAVIEIANRSHEITVEKLNNLFNRFYQIDQSRSKGGSGLGLAIVKSIVQIHQGKVNASFKDGYFSITIEWPLASEKNLILE